MAQPASATTSSTRYTIYRIPTDSPRFSELVTKFRDAKLAALVAEPNGFAVKHAEEVLHPLTIWQQRLVAPSTILICVATNEGHVKCASDEDDLVLGDWVGFVNIRGPLPHSIFHLPDSEQRVPANFDLETLWHLCSLYTTAAHRGKGLARQLVNAAIETARERTRALDGRDNMKARVRLFCDPEKTFIVNMYKGMGFEQNGKCTLREAYVANGDADVIPEDTTSTEQKRWLWDRRYGLAMEKIVDV